jgi:hypothetical protein
MEAAFGQDGSPAQMVHSGGSEVRTFQAGKLVGTYLSSLDWERMAGQSKGNLRTASGSSSLRSPVRINWARVAEGAGKPLPRHGRRWSPRRYSPSPHQPPRPSTRRPGALRQIPPAHRGLIAARGFLRPPAPSETGR